MRLVPRLTLTFALGLGVLLSGTGLALFTLIERDLRADFVRDLLGTARVQAGLALREDNLALTRLPGAALQVQLDEPQAYLLRADGSLVEALSDFPAPQLPQDALQSVLAGRSLSFVEGQSRPGGWVAAFSPTLTAHTRIALHPIYGVADGQFQVLYLVALRATDTGTVEALRRVRRVVLTGLALGLLTALLIGYILARVVAAPVRQMGEVASRVQAGDLTPRVRLSRRDELGDLSGAMNSMLERLQGLVEAQRRFTADAAHDLRTPLAVLRGEADLALKRERSAGEYRETLERMRGDLHGLSRLAEDLLTLARLEHAPPPAEAGTQSHLSGAGIQFPARRSAELRLQAVHLTDVLSMPLASATALAQMQGRTLEVQYPQELWLSADRALLSRAVLNLLTNALTHGGNVQLEAGSQGRAVWLAISDDGQGVAPGQRALMFERFGRSESSSGSGLGLAIALEVALAHGGTLRYEGPPEQKSTFTLHLPDALLTARPGPPA